MSAPTGASAVSVAGVCPFPCSTAPTAVSPSAPTRPSRPFPPSLPKKAPTPGSRWTPPTFCPGLRLPALRQERRLHQGGGHARRLVRLRLHALRRDEEGSGLLARHDVPRGPRPVPRLVPVLPADRRGRVRRGRSLQECVTHGWTVDGEGRAMHKSLGNGVDPADIFNENGADILRLWAASADLSRGCALLQGHLPAAQPELSQVPQHLQVHAR